MFFCEISLYSGGFYLDVVWYFVYFFGCVFLGNICSLNVFS